MAFNLERALPDGTCTPGSAKVFYRCASNNFRGCCSVDPCNQPGCPDEDDEEEQEISSSRTTTPRVSKTTTSQATLSIQDIATSTTSSSRSSSASSTPASFSTLTTSSTSHQTQSPIPSPARSSGPSKTPIIAGVVGGAVAVSIIAFLLWLLFRQRRQKRNNQISQALQRSPTKETLHNHAISRSLPGQQLADCFAPFGGRCDEPRFGSASTAVSPELQGSHSTSGFKQPGATSQDVTYHAVATEETTSLDDQQLYSPARASHPAASQASPLLSVVQHPVVSSPVSSPRDDISFHRNQPPYSPPSPNEAARGPRTDNDNGDAYAPAWRCSELSGISPLTSPVAGHSELEADVPGAPGSTSMPRLQLSEDLTRTPIIGLGVIPRPTSRTTMAGPLGPNLHPPREGEHLMSWATQGYKPPQRPRSSDHARSGSRDRGGAETQEQDQGSNGQGEEEEGSQLDVARVKKAPDLERWSGATAVQVESPGGSARS